MPCCWHPRHPMYGTVYDIFDVHGLVYGVYGNYGLVWMGPRRMRCLRA